MPPTSTSRGYLLLLFTILVSTLTGWALLTGTGTDLIDREPSPGGSNLDLYRAIIDRVSSGDGYYGAAVSEQIARGFPTSPAPTVRLPTMTWVFALAGPFGGQALHAALVSVAFLTAVIGFDRVSRSRVQWMAMSTLSAFCLYLFVIGDFRYFHESWAAPLLLLSACLRREGQFRTAVALAFFALCFRELAAPFVLAMGARALMARRWVETSWWAGSGVLFAVLYAIHAHLVQSQSEGQTNPTSSPGWVKLRGWSFIVDSVRETSVLMLFPYAFAAVAIAASFIGLVGMRRTLTTNFAVTAAGFAAVFTVIGRHENVYWGMLYSVLLLPGLACFPRVMTQSFRSRASGRRRKEHSEREIVE